MTDKETSPADVLYYSAAENLTSYLPLPPQIYPDVREYVLRMTVDVIEEAYKENIQDANKQIASLESQIERLAGSIADYNALVQANRHLAAKVESHEKNIHTCEIAIEAAITSIEPMVATHYPEKKLEDFPWIARLQKSLTLLKGILNEQGQAETGEGKEEAKARQKRKTKEPV